MPNDNLVVSAAMARKGGSGKTTLSRALISAAVAAGRRVLLIDTDSTGVLGTWHKQAEAAGLGSPLLRSATVESVGAVDRRIEQVYKEMDEKGLLHAVALQKRADPNPLMRPHVRHVVEALEEATDILAA